LSSHELGSLIFSAGPVSLVWEEGIGSQELDGLSWHVERRPPANPPPRRSVGEKWFNDEDWSGVESDDWVAWIGNRERRAIIWGATEDLALRHALPVVMPAALRREGYLDGHGAVLAPDPDRPDEAVFVCGLSGAGKSTLTVSATVGGARVLSDDSVALGVEGKALMAWPRRPILALSPETGERYLKDAPSGLMDGKRLFNIRRVFGDQCLESARIRTIAFLERGGETTARAPLSAVQSYAAILMGHPILALDEGARHCFPAVRTLSKLPGYQLRGGSDLLDPETARRVLADLLAPREN
jgi:hypothetical protein